MKSWLIGKDPDGGKDWGQEEKGVTEDEMVGWHHWLNGHEFEQTLGDGERQGNLVCCSPRDYKELDMTEWLNWDTQWGFPRGSVVKNPPANAGDEETKVWSLGWEDPGVRIGKPLRYSCLTKPMDWEAWQATVHGVTKESDTAEWLNTHTHTGRYSIESNSVVVYTLSQFSFLKANPCLVIELWDTEYLVTWRICVVVTDRAKGMLSQMQ